ncbi:MAG: ATP-binding protein [Candidatus Rokubacteria bacterium]|nr:ATP-binding protein [Candidatus Rokubacteria bacterium]
MRRQTAHLTRLLDDLLDVARITSGRIELEHEHLDLRHEIEQAVEAQRHRIDGKQQRLTLALPARAVPVFGDAVRLQQVVGNLLNNASKHTPPRGTIRITLDDDGADAVLEVADTGAGIAPDKLDAVFDLFEQANPSLARTEGGLGIGLTLVKRVVELHGGMVVAHSDGVGLGTKLVVRLPLAAPAAPAPAAPQRPVTRRPAGSWSSRITTTGARCW